MLRRCLYLVVKSNCRERFFRQLAVFSLMLLFFVGCFSGCSLKREASDKKDMEFTICNETMLPDELAQIIDEKKEKAFKITYAIGDSLYIAIGYGEHDRQNLNIVVDDLFYTKTAIYVDTQLVTDMATNLDAARTGEASMYPYIVLKIDKIDLPVIFETN